VLVAVSPISWLFSPGQRVSVRWPSPDERRLPQLTSVAANFAGAFVGADGSVLHRTRALRRRLRAAAREHRQHVVLVQQDQAILVTESTDLATSRQPVTIVPPRQLEEFALRRVRCHGQP